MNHMNFLSYVLVSLLRVIFSSYVSFRYSALKMAKYEEQKMAVVVKAANQMILKERKQLQDTQQQLVKFACALTQPRE